VSLNRPQDVREQYADSTKLTARADLHARYSTNPYGWHAWVCDRFDLAGDARVLDAGCGPAWLWRTNAARVPEGWSVVATDLSPGMAAQARDALEDARFAFCVANAQTLPFRNGAFDAVVANHMLYHVQDLDGTLSEFARVLCSGGVAFAATNGQRHLVELLQLVGGGGSEYIRTFGLETGPEALARHFDDVTVERYDDSLEVTDVEPVVSYVESMMMFRPGAEDEVRRRVAAEIERNGAFRISKDAGLIRAKRR
jgi:SAM-dependent methyltransferase